MTTLPSPLASGCPAGAVPPLADLAGQRVVASLLAQPTRANPSAPASNAAGPRAILIVMVLSLHVPTRRPARTGTQDVPVAGTVGQRGESMPASAQRAARRAAASSRRASTSTVVIRPAGPPADRRPGRLGRCPGRTPDELGGQVTAGDPGMVRCPGAPGRRPARPRSNRSAPQPDGGARRRWPGRTTSSARSGSGCARSRSRPAKSRAARHTSGVSPALCESQPSASRPPARCSTVCRARLNLPGRAAGSPGRRRRRCRSRRARRPRRRRPHRVAEQQPGAEHPEVVQVPHRPGPAGGGGGGGVLRAGRAGARSSHVELVGQLRRTGEQLVADQVVPDQGDPAGDEGVAGQGGDGLGLARARVAAAAGTAPGATPAPAADPARAGRRRAAPGRPAAGGPPCRVPAGW